MINLLSNLFIKIYICRHFKTVLAPMPICSMPHHPRPIKLWPLPEHAPVRVISSSSSSFSYSSGCCVLWRQWLPFLWQYYGIYHYITYMDPPSLFNIVINSVHNSYCSCVPDEHRALALGMQWVILRLLGNVIRSWKSSKIGNNNVIATLTQFKILLYAYVSTCMYVKWMYDRHYPWTSVDWLRLRHGVWTVAGPVWGARILWGVWPVRDELAAVHLVVLCQSVQWIHVHPGHDLLEGASQV